jgi:molybdenum cofactor cytidylyltransferase
VAAEAARLGLQVVANPDPSRGMASSVALGFAAVAGAENGARAALLWPVDHARVAPSTVARLVGEAAADRILVPTWRGRGGHPSAIGRAMWDEMASCDQLAEGARSVIRRDPARVRRLELEDRWVVADVDWPADLQ